MLLIILIKDQSSWSAWHFVAGQIKVYIGTMFFEKKNNNGLNSISLKNYATWKQIKAYVIFCLHIQFILDAQKYFCLCSNVVFLLSKMTLLSLTMYKIYWMPAKYTESVQNLLSMIKNYQNKLHAYNFILANR